MDDIFTVGFIYGILASLIIGLILKQMGNARRTISDRNKTLDKFSDAAQPKLTPASIVWKSFKAMLVWFFWFLVLLAALALIFNVALRWELTV